MGSAAAAAQPLRSATATAPLPERRQLTVMFADLVGSTPLGARLDPEDLREVLSTYHGCVASVVASFDGFVAHYVGDGVLVYFGYPHAHEDDAERAAHAGLGIVKAVSHLHTVAGPAGTLNARIGIATGIVVVGDLIGSGSSLETAVVGETPNLAARLQTLAEPGMVVIAETTRRLTGGLFEYRDLGAVKLKGIEAPVGAWAVIAESAIDSRFEALRSKQVPLVGRGDELELLLRRWEQAKSGAGRVLLLSGEPGMGKSRLIAALDQELGNRPRAGLRFLCSPYYQDTPLHPVIRQLERSAGFQRGDSAAARWDKLRSVLVPDALSEREVATIADLLSIPGVTSDVSESLAPLRRKERTFAVLLKHFRVLARQTPIVVVFEDIHWADPTTRELLDLVIETADQFPVLFVITSRPELQPSWAARAHVTVRVLNGLDRREAALLVADLAGDRRLPEDVAERIVAHADGVPLFIEELTRTVLDAAPSGPTPDPLDRHGPPLSADAVPVSLQASLMARLDRLTTGKEVAQTGAVIGREFSFESLQGVSNLPAPQLEHALGELIQAGVIIARGEPPDALYTFKHALVQDAAYASMLRDRRRAIHLRLAEVLEQDVVGAAREPQLVAWHFAEGGAPERSIAYYEKAAQQATGRFALTEIVAHLRKALAQLERLPDSGERQRRELDLQVALGRALIDCHGSGSEDVRGVFQRARELCLGLGETKQLPRIYDGLVLNYAFTHSETQQILRYAGELDEIGARTGDPEVLLMARQSRLRANLLVGRFEDARDEMELVLAAFERNARSGATARDQTVSLNTMLGICLTALGYPDSGAAACLKGVRHAESLNHVISLVLGLRRACVQCMMQKNRRGATDFYNRLLQINAEYETFKGTREAIIFHAWSQPDLRRDPSLLDRVQACLEQLDSGRHRALLPFFMANVAEVRGQHGDRAGAVNLLERAAELAAITGEQWYMAEIMRLQSHFTARDPDDAMALLQSSLATAREQGAKLWELRTATDVAKQWHQQGKGDAARDFLAPIYGWFTEGFDTPDLVAARTLLAELNWRPVPAAHDVA
ncbi:MAG: AAA family ATPase [Xanthobacteraceae bacterium]